MFGTQRLSPHMQHNFGQSCDCWRNSTFDNDPVVSKGLFDIRMFGKRPVESQRPPFELNLGNPIRKRAIFDMPPHFNANIDQHTKQVLHKSVRRKGRGTGHLRKGFAKYCACNVFGTHRLMQRIWHTSLMQRILQTQLMQRIRHRHRACSALGTRRLCSAFGRRSSLSAPRPQP